MKKKKNVKKEKMWTMKKCEQWKNEKRKIGEKEKNMKKVI